MEIGDQKCVEISRVTREHFTAHHIIPPSYKYALRNCTYSTNTTIFSVCYGKSGPEYIKRK